MYFGAYVTAVYALVVLAGGLVGYFVGQSKPSLFAGLIFGILLGLCSYGMFKNSGTAKIGAMVLSGILTLFFANRYLTTLKFMPAGLMIVLSVITLLLLLFKNDQS